MCVCLCGSDADNNYINSSIAFLLCLSSSPSPPLLCFTIMPCLFVYQYVCVCVRVCVCVCVCVCAHEWVIAEELPFPTRLYFKQTAEALPRVHLWSLNVSVCVCVCACVCLCVCVGHNICLLAQMHVCTTRALI